MPGVIINRACGETRQIGQVFTIYILFHAEATTLYLNLSQSMGNIPWASCVEVICQYKKGILLCYQIRVTLFCITFTQHPFANA